MLYKDIFQISTSCSSSYIIIGNVFGPTDFNLGMFFFNKYRNEVKNLNKFLKSIIIHTKTVFYHLGKRGYIGDNSDQFVIGPEFCGGALSKGGNKIAEESDNTGGLISSK